MSDGLVLDFGDEEKIIDGNNEVFEGTPLYGKNFKFYVHPIDGDTLDTVRRKHIKIKSRGREDQNSREVEKELFYRQVINWEGIAAPDGKTIPCTSENKKLVANGKFMLASMVNLACLNLQIEGNEAREEEVKN